MNSSPSPMAHLLDKNGASLESNDEFGLKRYLSSWTHDSLIRYDEIEHLCPRTPILRDDQGTGGTQKPVVGLDERIVNAFLDTVGEPTLQSITWDIVNRVTSCARHLIDRVPLNKAWYSIGPAEARTISYVYSISGVDHVSLSVASMAREVGGVTLNEQAHSTAVLSALPPFWRVVVLASTLFKPGRRQGRRARLAGDSKTQRKGARGPPAKKP